MSPALPGRAGPQDQRQPGKRQFGPAGAADRRAVTI